MAAIDVGSPAINRSSATSFLMTDILKDNPADGNGLITTVEVWANTNLSNFEVALFEEVAANTFTTRSNVTIGAVTAGSKQTFSGLSLAVAVGDYIGYYRTAGALEKDNSGAGNWYDPGDKIPCVSEGFTSNPNVTLSLYGMGSTPGGAEDKTANMGTKMIAGKLI